MGGISSDGAMREVVGQSVWLAGGVVGGVGVEEVEVVQCLCEEWTNGVQLH